MRGPVKQESTPIYWQWSVKSALKLLFGIILITTLIVAAKYFNIQGLLKSALEWVASLGPWGPILFVVTYIVATVLLIPGSLLTLGAGTIFGVVLGSICVSIGATIGATAAFLVGRYLAQGWVEKRIAGDPKFQAIDQAVATKGWKIVGLARLSPVFPFNLLNYAFGVTQVSFKDYFLATWIGITPGTVLYVYLGSAGSLALLGVEERTRAPLEWLFYAVGLVAAIAVSLYVTRIAKRALEQIS